MISKEKAHKVLPAQYLLRSFCCVTFATHHLFYGRQSTFPYQNIFSLFLMYPMKSIFRSFLTVWVLWLFLVWMTLGSCTSTQPVIQTQCTANDSQKVAHTLNSIHRSIGLEYLRRLASANQPTSDGALSRNTTGYFHVRFQMSISALTTYAILAENTTELEKAVKAIEYSFQYQLPDGDFRLIQPTSLSQLPPASEVDLASGTAFFLSSLGVCLSTMQESRWFTTSTEARPYRERIEQLRPSITLALQMLMRKRDILLRGDAQAPNRLFFDALAYQTLGTYVNNTEAQTLATQFIEAALALQVSEGYFKEGTGYDSSYQGVGVSVGWNVYLTLPTNQNILRERLWKALSCGTSWQQSRIAQSGEILTQGNARVYPGGEKFLGEEKSIAWKDTVFSFWYYFHLSQLLEYNSLAMKVLKYYDR